MSVGASGVISVAANLIPKDVARLCALVAQNKIADARKLHLKMFPLIKALFLETSPMPIKAAMEDMGLIRSGALRSPLVTISAGNRRKLQAAIKAYGVKRGSL
jgi:4-hydroxy-tetrahydrodipicolinate synthase